MLYWRHKESGHCFASEMAMLEKDYDLISLKEYQDYKAGKANRSTIDEYLQHIKTRIVKAGISHIHKDKDK